MPETARRIEADSGGGKGRQKQTRTGYSKNKEGRSVVATTARLLRAISAPAYSTTTGLNSGGAPK